MGRTHDCRTWRTAYRAMTKRRPWHGTVTNPGAITHTGTMILTGTIAYSGSVVGMITGTVVTHSGMG